MALPKPTWLTDEARFVLLVMLGGLALRLIWLGEVHGTIASFLSAAEAAWVALAFAKTGMVSDAYFAGQGATAHLLPVNPVIAGLVLRLFGPWSIAASLTLLAWSLAQVACAYLLLHAVFRRLGADPAALRWGMALLCVVPVFAPQETVDFRYWEGGSALALGALNLLLIVRLDLSTEPRLGWPMMAGIAALAALTFFVSPQVGLATGLCWAVVALRRLPLRRALQLAGLAAAALALLVGPWVLRNAEALGAPVLRSNFGLELALANHPEALSSRPPEQVFATRLGQIHPMGNPRARPIIEQRGGEIRYANQLGAETGRWIAANPGGFAWLCLRHLSEFLFPRPWQMYFTGWEGMREARAWTMSLVHLLGLVGLALALRARRRGYWVLAAYVAMIALPYAMFQPMARYIYLIYAPLAFLAAEAAVRLWRAQPSASVSSASSARSGRI